VIVEIYRGIHYIVLYPFKIFYEIVKYLDNAEIKKIIKSRIIGFILISV
jgi:hypothetical protein